MWEAKLFDGSARNYLPETLTCLATLVNRLEVAEMRSCLKTSSERSVLSQSTPDDDEAAAAAQQMAELLETCVVLKSALDAAVTRIAALEKHHDAVSRELTSVKLKLQLAERVKSETSVPTQVQPAEVAWSTVATVAAGGTKPTDASLDTAQNAATYELAATHSAATANRARHFSDSSDIIITGYIAPTATAEPAVGFTLPAQDRRRLVRQKRHSWVTRSTTPTQETTAIPTHNRFEVLDDRQPTDVSFRVVKRPTAPHKVYVGTFDPETSETMMRAYLRQHVIENEMEITDVQKLRPQSRTTVMACSFCVTVDSSAARNALFDKTAWPSGVTVCDFRPHIPKGAGDRQGSNGQGFGTRRDQHDRPVCMQAGRQGDRRRVERAARPPRTPRTTHAMRPPRRDEQERKRDDRNREEPRHRLVPRRH